MKIKSNAVPEELDSPFYIENKKFCQVFERFIAGKEGKVRGRYNAWSYLIEGKIETLKSWNLFYKKSTFSGGNLLLSSKYQNLLTIAEWTCHAVNAKNAMFFIRKRKFIDIMKPSYLKLKQHPAYVMKTNGEYLPYFSKVLNTLEMLFETNEIYTITLKNNKLTIELRTEKHHFNIFNELIQLS
ncbi:hypothetical protein [uncultured Kordia sp.]|uniref:hypothetical protein n=1 Tax=uncultured Kordia sp. TaxID=507699 RepID=UPI002601CECB|nr:hypothetical protein [uncultured Kordia sp.]